MLEDSLQPVKDLLGGHFWILEVFLVVLLVLVVNLFLRRFFKTPENTARKN